MMDDGVPISKTSFTCYTTDLQFGSNCENEESPF